MKWIRIPKEKARQPVKGSYKDWKEPLAEEGHHQCVYCAVPESSFGGIRNFHVEHYKPKAKNRFPELTNNFFNLYYACAICNTFKSDDWPGEPLDDLSNICYPNPSTTDYNRIFALVPKGEVLGNNTAARYMVEKLYLNRPQLIIERRHAEVCEQHNNSITRISQLLDQLGTQQDAISRQLLLDLLQLVMEISRVFSQYRNVIPYREEDVKRP